MVAVIESGIIFCLLPINVLFMSTAMYTIEHVKNTQDRFSSVIALLRWYVKTFCHNLFW